MRQIVSMVKDGQVRYASVDEETGELKQFALVLVDEHFDLELCAELGTNLIRVTGLNGKPRAKARAQRALPPADQPSLLDEPAALPPVPRNVKKADNHPSRKAAGARGRPSVMPYISFEDILAVVNKHPEGIAVSAVAEWLNLDLQVNDRAWCVKTVSNRVSSYEERAKRLGEALPYRIELRQRYRQDGSPMKDLVSKWLIPVTP